MSAHTHARRKMRAGVNGGKMTLPDSCSLCYNLKSQIEARFAYCVSWCFAVQFHQQLNTRLVNPAACFGLATTAHNPPDLRLTTPYRYTTLNRPDARDATVAGSVQCAYVQECEG